MKKIVVGIISFIMAICVLAILFVLFTVRRFEISGNANIQGVQAYSHAFLPFLNEHKVENEIYAQNPQLSSIRIVKKYPGTIVIDVKESTPVAEILTEKGSIIFNDAGRIVQINATSDLQRSDLPVISYYQKLNIHEYAVGDAIGKEDLEYALNFLGQLKTVKVTIERIDITSPYMIVLVNAQERYLITVEKDRDVQFQEFKLVYERLLQKGEKYSQIDVRFEKPIITY